MWSRRWDPSPAPPGRRHQGKIEPMNSRRLLTVAALAAAALAGGAANARAQTQDYRCILDSVTAADHQAAVALYSKLFVDSTKDEFPANPHETDALEARMDKLSDDCAAKNHWS